MKLAEEVKWILEDINPKFKKDDFIAHKRTGRMAKISTISGDGEIVGIQYNGEDEIKEYPKERIAKHFYKSK